MKKNSVIIAFSVLAISWMPSVFAGQSPESVVTCQILGPGIYKLYGLSVPTAINAEQCIQSDVVFPCAQCISSLEDQGCKTVDVVTGKSNEIPNVTYFLSCVKP